MWTYGGSLPLNRKERFYTGTVLPQIIGCHDLEHLDIFFDLCGIPDVCPGSVQIFTEYSFAQSMFLDGGFVMPKYRDMPDLVVATEQHLLVVEAKVFHDVPPGKINEQLEKQALLAERGIWHMKNSLSVEYKPLLRQVALLPEMSKANANCEVLTAPVVTWEAVLLAYSSVAPRYWLEVLSEALSNYKALVSSGAWSGSGKNATGKLAGHEIVNLAKSDAASFDRVGRKGGLYGEFFQDDLESSAWYSRKYEIGSGGPPNKNWMTLKDFLGAVTSMGGGDCSDDA